VARIGLELSGEPAVPEMMRIARRAEALGYDSIWLTETRFTRDAVSTCAAVAAVTNRVRVGTAVVNPFTRGAALTAVTAATLDELAGGRFVLGIGPGSPTVLARQGIAFRQPLARVRETVAVVRAMVNGGSARFDGGGAELDFTPVRPEIPVYLGVTGPRALDLAGEIADGVILNAFVSVGYTERAVERIRAAAQRAGRDPDSIEVAQSLAVSIDNDGERARDAIRPLVATYLAQFPNIARESGIAESTLAGIAALFAERGAASAAELIADEVVAALTCAGSPAECRQAIARRREAGVDLSIAGFAHGCSDENLAALI
jgi:5,10-methylenetetrahydromethanopterin reductase